MTRRETTIPELAGGGGRRGAAAGLALALVGSAILGLPAGLIWGEVAPRALLREISVGTAEVIHPETSAFIGADGWFCLIAAVAGLLTGLAGYRFGIARRGQGAGAAVTAGLVLGAVAAGFVMLWLGEQIGRSGYTRDLASSPHGTMFNASLALGAKSALAFWPLLTAIVIVLGEIVRGDRRRSQSPDGQ